MVSCASNGLISKYLIEDKHRIAYIPPYMRFERFQGYLNLRFPAMTTYRHASILSLAAVICVTVLFLLFQPFGLNRIEPPYRLFKIGAFSFAYLPVVWGYCLLFVYFIRINDFGNKWRLKHEILNNVGIILLLGIFNFILLTPILDRGYSLYAFLEIIVMTTAVTFVPIAVMTGIELIHFQYRDQSVQGSKTDSEMEGEVDIPIKDRTIILFGSNKNDSIEIGIDCLLFIQSQGNYVELVLEESSKQLKREMLRVSLKEIMTQLSGESEFKRVHRSYAVNMNRIINARGNAHGMTISLGDSNAEIPVSRQYTALLKPVQLKLRRKSAIA